jgi:membrane associated rhomboid family serine protease
MIFPIGDTQVQGAYKPYFAYGFLALNLLVFLVQMATPGNLICEYAVIPHNIIEGSHYYTLITSLFLHAGYMHIAGNLLFLWVFADNIEALVGSSKFIMFYLAGGVIASLTHIIMDGFGATELNCCQPCLNCQDTDSNYCQSYIPSLGASGAISAVMGAYMVMFPKSEIKVLIVFLFRSFKVSAWVFLAIWFAQQLLSGIGTNSAIQTASNDGVAWWAHIGGFVFGLVAGLYFKKYVKYHSLNASLEKSHYV